MQQISINDDIEILWKERSPEDVNGHQEGSKLNIRITTNKKFLPTDRSNLAYKAALIMEQKAMEMGRPVSGDLQIDIFKRIPVAAGLANYCDFMILDRLTEKIKLFPAEFGQFIEEQDTPVGK